MDNLNIIKQASHDLLLADENDIVKVASLTQRLKVWLNSLINPEYKRKVDELKNKSFKVKLLIEELLASIDKLNQSIENANLDSYTDSLREIRKKSLELSNELSEVSDVVVEAAPPPEAIKSDLSKIKFIEQPITVNAKERADKYINESLDFRRASQNIINAVMSNLDIFYKELFNSVLKGGKIESSKDAVSGKQFKNFEGDKHIQVSCEFSLPSLGLSYIYALVAFRDYSARISGPSPMLSFKGIDQLRFSFVEGFQEQNKTQAFDNVKLKEFGFIKSATPWDCNDISDINYAFLDDKKDTIELYNFPGIETTSSEFRKKLIETALWLDVDPNWLAAVISLESNFKPHIQNRFSKATGLIQFMPATARQFNLTLDEIKNMDAITQLERCVKPYFASRRGRLNSLEDTYLHVFYPAAIGKNKDDIIGAPGTKIYEQNKGFDKNQKGYFTKKDITGSISSIYNSAKSKAPIAVYKINGNNVQEISSNITSIPQQLSTPSQNANSLADSSDSSFEKLIDMFMGAFKSLKASDEDNVCKLVRKGILEKEFLKEKI